MSDKNEHTVYDLSLPLQSLDGRPITPANMGIPPTYAEEKDSGWSDETKECTVESYVVSACPVSRAISLALLADQHKDEEDKKKSAKQKRQERTEKETRYEIATVIAMKTRDNGATRVPLKPAEVELILDRCSDLFGTVPHGCIKGALSSPVVTADEEA